jgi:UDP-N-acetylglucosamine--N-acetylmuramyl-(pentapeptide) pyrophosphoryl-undecaprenol N-acetylglucosamine transferase
VSRALRTLFVANDGFSTGHVTRTLAIARALEGTKLLVTTSEADALLACESIAVMRLPSPARAREAGLQDVERRRIARAAIEATVDAFAPDLIVVDTFPSGPHGELAGLGRRGRRVLVRRAVPDPQADLLTTGLGDYDLAIVATDAGATSTLAIPTVTVPPIVLTGAASSRADARRALGLPLDGRAWLVTTGGGGDAEAAIRVRALAAEVARAGDPVVLALGPLDRAPAELAGVITVRVTPLAPQLRAFDGAIAAAGYNTAHELAAAGVPAALFALPRPFDDQAARARRLAAMGHACVHDSVEASLAWLRAAKVSPLVCDGAARAAQALVEVMG